MSRSPVELVLILTTDCNLRCAYCYQDARQRRAMGWPVVRAAVDVLAVPPRSPGTISFSGGEPTLRWGTIERAVEYVNGGAPGGSGTARAAFHLTTNGLRLGDAELSFLAQHDFTVDLSMDGVEPAQDGRGKATFGRLDDLLGRWRTTHPTHFASRCRVALTVSRLTVPFLADSVRYLHAHAVPDILLQPAMGDTGWKATDLATLDALLGQVEAEAVRHRARTGEVPLGAFRAPARSLERRKWGCSVPLGRSLAVDVDGQVYPCVLAARSYQRIESREAAPRLACLALGDIRDGLAALKPSKEAAEESGLFDPKALQHSGERSCRSCGFRGACLVCPIGRTWGSRSADCNEIPGYLCAFNRMLQEHARRFRAARGAAAPGDSGRVLRWVLSRPATT